MSTLVPRKPYTEDELRQLYPDGLQLHLVQILMRHGERTPVSARFQNTGLRAFWPYCANVRQMKTALMAHGGDYTTLEWKRRLETFGERDQPVIAAGPNGQVDDVCDMGSLTDTGRRSTFQLGERLRELYVNRLKFLPPSLRSTESLYLRATPIPRAMESMQQTFTALYPPSTREPDETGSFPAPVIVTRAPGDETLFPNDYNCRRFAQMSRAFAQRAADRWNTTEDMEYLNKVLGKWMPPDRPRIAVDSRPRLSGIMDTINATAAHGPETKLPPEFYDAKAKKIMEKIAVEEWFAGYKESREYRMVGIGGLLGDVVERMVGSAENPPNKVKFGLSGCHDTTLAAVLASLGAFEDNVWPPFTSHIAIEMFRRSEPIAATGSRNWWGSLFGTGSSSPLGRKPSPELSASEKKKLDGYYVRLRYNDEPVTIPGCKAPGNHLDGDESFCTLAAFKEIVDKFTPQNWKSACRMNRDSPGIPAGESEPAGY
ncbi:histidine phosphatase superfamily [Podospora aff. communis PSN243]|uniref:3-phytase n=1 Tax=Podospora aff. communis PSN243 TaxID=3040156 RepID=A0AAV9G0T7_9PEZI|nr:histidine phosphatase superfamily [Podospora aff. communis PSN243]